MSAYVPKEYQRSVLESVQKYFRAVQAFRRENTEGLKVFESNGALMSHFEHLDHAQIAELQRDLGLSYRPEHWDETRLATWLTRNLPETAITHASKRAFVAHWLRTLLDTEGFDLARANRQKFLIRTLLEARVRELRLAAVDAAYQSALFGDDAASRVAVGGDYTFEFNPQGYAPSRDYDGRFGVFDFRKHYYGRVGDFDSKIAGTMPRTTATSADYGKP